MAFFLAARLLIRFVLRTRGVVHGCRGSLGPSSQVDRREAMKGAHDET